MMKKRTFLRAMVAGAGASAVPMAFADEAFPSQAIRLVVGFAPGGATDVLARAIANRLSAKYPKGVIVENRVGAGGTIAAGVVANAKPDGHTLAFASTGAFSIAPSLFAKLPYDPAKDFAPVALVAQATYALVVNPSVPAQNVREFVAWAKANPGKLSYGSFGNGSVAHLLGELFKTTAGVDAVHIPYGGSPAMVTATIAGDVAFSIDTLQSTLPHIRSGKVRPLAVVAGKRSGVAPDIPTFAEQGIAGLDLQNWFGVTAPAATPKDVVEMLARDIDAVVGEPEFRDLCSRQGADAAHARTAEFGRFLASQQARWGQLAKASGAKVG